MSEALFHLMSGTQRFAPRASLARAFVYALAFTAGTEAQMDFIERLFGFSPDGGSGALEVLLFAAPITVLCYFALRRGQRQRQGQ
jgi:hypothetical protein